MNAVKTTKAQGLKFPSLMIGFGMFILYLAGNYGLRTVLPIAFSDRVPEAVAAASTHPSLYRYPWEFLLLFAGIALLSLGAILAGLVIFLMRWSTSRRIAENSPPGN